MEVGNLSDMWNGNLAAVNYERDRVFEYRVTTMETTARSLETHNH